MALNNDALLGRIRGLLDTAEDKATTPEAAESYTAKAAELMAKYGIEAAMIQDREPQKSAPTDRKITVCNPWAMNKIRLLSWLAKSMGCEAIHLGRTGEGGARQVHLFGYSSDLDRVEMLYTSLLRQMVNALAKVSVPTWESPKKYRNGWILGFINRVMQRVAEMEGRAASEAIPAAGGRSTALVLADRSKQVERAKKKVYPRVRTSRASHSSGSGYGAGIAAGGRADIGGERVGASGRGAISR